jgi:hypothetical protein
MPKGIYPRTKEHRKLMSNILKGRIISEEQRKLISESKKGCISWNKGISCSEEQKENIRKTLIGYKHNQETKDLWSKQRKGVPKSEEHRKNIGKANKGRQPSHKCFRGKGCYYDSPLQGKIYLKSSYEIAYAKWLDLNNILWLYEMERFGLGETTYTPDFFLPKFEKFIEVKGYMSPEAQKKIYMFKEQYPWDLEVLYYEDLKKLGCDL